MCLSDSEVKSSALGSDVCSVLSSRSHPSKARGALGSSEVLLEENYRHGICTLPRTTTTTTCRKASSTTSSRSVDAVAQHHHLSSRKSASSVYNVRSRTRVPRWIRSIFSIAKKGDLEALKFSLRDMDTALIRNLSDGNGNNLWHVCAAHNHLNCFQWLCQKDVHHALSDENKNGLTPVATAVKHGNLDVVQWLVTKCLVMDQLDPPEGSRNLLHLAAKYGQEKLVHWLSEYMHNNDLSINRKDIDGNTAVHLAAKYGHIPCVKGLVLHEADVTLKNETGLKPFNLALQNSNAACADYLLTIEACLSLSSEHVMMEANLQNLQGENVEMKNGFKELLILTKRLLRRQEEMLHYVRNVCTGKLISEDAEVDTASTISSLSRKTSGSLVSQCRDESKSLAKLQVFLEKMQLKFIPEDEGRLLQIEEKWRRIRLHINKRLEEKRSPLDVVRSHFAQVLAKSSDVPVLSDIRPVSSSDTSFSEDSLDSAEEEKKEIVQKSSLPSWLNSENDAKSPPCNQVMLSQDKVNAFLQGLTIPGKETPSYITSEVKRDLLGQGSNTVVIRNGVGVGFKSKSQGKTRIRDYRKSPVSNSSSISTIRDIYRSQENVSLRVLFENNPELRQEGQTCSVLEVLEPSSSENEVEEEKPVKSSRSCKKEAKQESGNSSSSSFRSNKGYKETTNQFNSSDQRYQKQGSSSSSNIEGGGSNGGRMEVKSTELSKHVTPKPPVSTDSGHSHSILLTNIAELPDCSSSYKFSVKIQQSQECRHVNMNDGMNKEEPENNEQCAYVSENKVRNMEETSYSEPDLIKGTKQNNLTNCSNIQREPSKTSSPEDLGDARSSKSSGQELCLPEETQTNDCSRDRVIISRNSQISVESQGSVIEVSTPGSSLVALQGSGLKKRGFLLKFSLKGRWPSKQKQKKSEEITPDEFKETYTRTGATESISSQENKVSVQTLKNSYQQLLPEDMQSESICSDSPKHFSKDRSSLLRCKEVPPPVPIPLSPRREPPPIPQSADDNNLVSAAESDHMFVKEESMQRPHTLPRPRIPSSATSDSLYIHTAQSSQDSTMLLSESVISKTESLSRPASSASQMESPARSEDTYKSAGFPLRNALSSSTELLVTPESSIAGRQSPAPSEVSKTESALSPPSDVSKNESARHSSHLGKIEEIVNNNSSSNKMNSKTESSLNNLQFSEIKVKNSSIETSKTFKSEPAETILLTSSSAEEKDPELLVAKVKKTAAALKKKSSKPWYEVSDEEDMLTPDRYQKATGGIRSSSEDETEIEISA